MPSLALIGTASRLRSTTEERPNIQRGGLRIWTDPDGIKSRLCLRRSAGDDDTGLLVFSSHPKQEIGNPKILVRGLMGPYQIPERRLPFYLRAARVGGFVWHDRDGTPWHLHVRTHMLATTGRHLEIHFLPRHRPLWQLPDEELQGLVDYAVLDSPQKGGEEPCADATR